MPRPTYTPVPRTDGLKTFEVWVTVATKSHVDSMYAVLSTRNKNTFTLWNGIDSAGIMRGDQYPPGVLCCFAVDFKSVRHKVTRKVLYVGHMTIALRVDLKPFDVEEREWAIQCPLFTS